MKPKDKGSDPLRVHFVHLVRCLIVLLMRAEGYFKDPDQEHDLVKIAESCKSASELFNLIGDEFLFEAYERGEKQ